MNFSGYKNIAAAFGLLIFLLSNAPVVQSQTCSCAGAPLIGSQSVSTLSSGNVVVGLSYKYNNISDLYNGNRQLEASNVYRSTMTTLFEASYGLTDRLTLSGTFTYIRKSKESGLQAPSGEQSTVTNGIGDALFLVKYALHPFSLWEKYQIVVGGGTKIPFGNTTLSNNGIQLNADMQSGTGAWDGIFWSYFSKTFVDPSLNIFASTSFRLTGSADRFNKNDSYRFGNEFVSAMGTTGPLAERLSYTLSLQYRSAASDQRNGNTIANTGGKWLNVKPSLGYQLSNNLSAQVSGQLPVYNYLNNTQPTTAYILSASFFYSFNNEEKGFINI